VSSQPCSPAIWGGVLHPKFIAVCDSHHGATTRRTWRCSTKRGHKLVRPEAAPMPLACRDEQSSKLDIIGRGVRSPHSYRQGTSQPRYAFGRGHSLAQDGKGRARPRRALKPRPDALESACQSDCVPPFAQAQAYRMLQPILNATMQRAHECALSWPTTSRPRPCWHATWRIGSRKDNDLGS
jgi:hypothetical protein